MSGKARMEFVYSMCNDVRAMQRFYGEILDLEHKWSPEKGWLQLKIGVTLIFFQWDVPTLPTVGDWAWQPGYKGGDGSATSWGIEYPDLESYRAAVDRAIAADVPAWQAKPEWRRDCYWGYALRDPMGNTIELTVEPKNKPDVLEWI